MVELKKKNLSRLPPIVILYEMNYGEAFFGES